MRPRKDGYIDEWNFGIAFFKLVPYKYVVGSIGVWNVLLKIPQQLWNSEDMIHMMREQSGNVTLLGKMIYSMDLYPQYKLQCIIIMLYTIILTACLYLLHNNHLQTILNAPWCQIRKICCSGGCLWCSQWLLCPFFHTRPYLMWKSECTCHARATECVDRLQCVCSLNTK